MRSVNSFHYSAHWAKRVFDLFLCIIVLAPAAFLTIFFGFVFFAVTRENPLFVQERIGQNLKPFKLYKLRTMSRTTSDRPTHEVSSSQIPKVGRLMRSIKVDELPQLVNVLIGDMSFVGPRPCLPSQTQLIRERSDRGVYSVLPGITGLAQVNGIDMKDANLLACADSNYVQNSSFLEDVKLLFKTLAGHGQGDRTN